MDTFLGEPVSFWTEIRVRMQKEPGFPERAALLNEVVALRGKIAFYEERVRQMNEFAKEQA